MWKVFFFIMYLYMYVRFIKKRVRENGTETIYWEYCIHTVLNIDQLVT